MNKFIGYFYLLVLAFSIYPTLSFAQDEDSAIIIMYHRFGEDNFPSTNVTLEQIDQHIEELSDDKYNIIPLRTLTSALKNGEKLPPRTIAITIDDGFLSIYTEAWEKFKTANMPFTVFVSTEQVEDKIENIMSWDQIRELDADPLVEIGHHGHAHAHMTEITTAEALQDINTADEIFERELGYIPDILAYPYGEYSEALINAISHKNYHVALAQHSGVASSRSNMMAIPRFAFNQNYSDINRFKLIVNSRALPVKDILPRSASLETNPPAVGFTVDDTIVGLDSMSCFPSHMSEAASITRLGDNRVEIRFEEPFPRGRSRINCTMPGPDGRWYWLGMPFFNLDEKE